VAEQPQQPAAKASPKAVPKVSPEQAEPAQPQQGGWRRVRPGEEP
jgi:hypothetical protein